MTNAEIIKYVLNWRMWFGATIGAIMVYALLWAAPVACVVAGGSEQVCGL